MAFAGLTGWVLPGMSDDIQANTATLVDLLEDLPIGMLTTFGPDGPRSVPMARQEVEPSAELWFITARDTAHTRAIEQDPRVALTFSARDTWVAVYGRAAGGGAPAKGTAYAGSLSEKALSSAWAPLSGRAAAGGLAANTGRAVVDAGKFDYLFGTVSSNAHNAARSAQNAQQLARIGVYDNAAGRSLLSSHFDDVVVGSNNVARTFTNEYGTFQVRDAGPGGFLKFESTWQVTDDGLRLTTVIPMGGS